MRFQQIRHLNCHVTTLVFEGGMESSLWASFCAECERLLPGGRACIKRKPAPMACWEADGASVRLVFFAVSDGTDLLLEMDTGIGMGLVETMRPRYRHRLHTFMQALKSSYDTRPRLSWWERLRWG